MKSLSPRFYSLWSINGALDQARLRRQLDQLKVAGMDGVVWHPRFYPGEPPYLGNRYLAEVSDAILHAKSLGLAFWIYDEDGWPSGTVSGQLLKKYPDDVGLTSSQKSPNVALLNLNMTGKNGSWRNMRGKGWIISAVISPDIFSR